MTGSLHGALLVAVIFSHIGQESQFGFDSSSGWMSQVIDTASDMLRKDKATLVYHELDRYGSGYLVNSRLHVPNVSVDARITVEQQSITRILFGLEYSILEPMHFSVTPAKELTYEYDSVKHTGIFTSSRDIIRSNREYCYGFCSTPFIFGLDVRREFCELGELRYTGNTERRQQCRVYALHPDFCHFSAHDAREHKHQHHPIHDCTYHSAFIHLKIKNRVECNLDRGWSCHLIPEHSKQVNCRTSSDFHQAPDYCSVVRNGDFLNIFAGRDADVIAEQLNAYFIPRFFDGDHTGHNPENGLLQCLHYGSKFKQFCSFNRVVNQQTMAIDAEQHSLAIPGEASQDIIDRLRQWNIDAFVNVHFSYSGGGQCLSPILPLPWLEIVSQKSNFLLGRMLLGEPILRISMNYMDIAEHFLAAQPDANHQMQIYFAIDVKNPAEEALQKVLYSAPLRTDCNIAIDHVEIELDQKSLVRLLRHEEKKIELMVELDKKSSVLHAFYLSSAKPDMCWASFIKRTFLLHYQDDFVEHDVPVELQAEIGAFVIESFPSSGGWAWLSRSQKVKNGWRYFLRALQLPQCIGRENEIAIHPDVFVDNGIIKHQRAWENANHFLRLQEDLKTLRHTSSTMKTYLKPDNDKPMLEGGTT